MTAETAILAGRAAIEALMVDACISWHPTGFVTDPSTGVVTPTYSTIYEGKCRVQWPGLVGGSPEAGEHAWTTGFPVLQLPMSAPAHAVDDVVIITASVLDPELVGVTLRVRSLFHKSHATARRMVCEEVQG